MIFSPLPRSPRQHFFFQQVLWKMEFIVLQSPLYKSQLWIHSASWFRRHTLLRYIINTLFITTYLPNLFHILYCTSYVCLCKRCAESFWLFSNNWHDKCVKDVKKDHKGHHHFKGKNNSLIQSYSCFFFFNNFYILSPFCFRIFRRNPDHCRSACYEGNRLQYKSRF